MFLNVYYIERYFLNGSLEEKSHDISANTVIFKVLKNSLFFKKNINRYQLILEVDFDLLTSISERLGYFRVKVQDSNHSNIEINIRISDFSTITKLSDTKMSRVSVVGESLVFSRMYYESNLYNFDFYNSQYDNLSNLNELSSVNQILLSGTYSTSGFLSDVLLGAGFSRIYGNIPLQLNVNNDYLSRTVMIILILMKT
jgi:hypothetical protein